MKSGEVIIPQQGIGVRYATPRQLASVNPLGATRTGTDTRGSGRTRSQRGMSGYSSILLPVGPVGLLGS